MKPALFVIDMQARFYHLDPAIKASYEKAIPMINEAVGIFREKKLPIAAILHKEGDLQPGADGFEMFESIDLKGPDIRIEKTYGNAFNKTTLGATLKAFGVDTVVLTGFCAEYCVLSTFRGAKDLDLNPFVLRGALASDNEMHVRFVENISDVVTLQGLRTFF